MAAKKVISIRAAEEQTEIWRMYVDARGMKFTDIVADAMNEYLQNHPLNDTEKAIYDARVSQKRENQ